MLAAHQSPETIATRWYPVVAFAHESKCAEPKAAREADITKWFASRRLQPETAYAYQTGLRQFFRFALEHDYCPSDPTAKLPRITRPQTIPNPVPDAAIESALAHAEHRVRIMIRLAAEHDLRCCEIARMRGTDLIEMPDGLVLRITGKGGKQRLAFIDNDELEIIYAFKNAGNNPIFAGAKDGCLAPKYVGKLIRRELPGDWTAHKLRCRFATMAYRANPDILALQALMGHSSPETTKRYILVASPIGRQVSAGARLPHTASESKQ